MLKLNKKGFALVETLIVTVFVATIFTIMYTNFFPMFGEYERRENYDDVDSIYRTYLLKRMFENFDFRAGKDPLYNGYRALIGSKKFVSIYDVDYTVKNSQLAARDQSIITNCGVLTHSKSDYCVGVMTNAKVSNIYLTDYNISDLKRKIKRGEINETEMNVQMQDYIDTLPYFKHNPNYKNKYRIIVQYAKEINKESENKSVIYSYSTIGVNL